MRIAYSNVVRGVRELTIKGQVEFHKFWKPYLSLFFIQLVGISALLRANVSYIDDLGRVVEGYKQWQVMSRYVSWGLSSFLHGDAHHLSDISPLPQLLAAGLMALAGLLVILLLTEGRERRTPAIAIIAVTPLGLCPYFLQCYSYKYDAPYMALSVIIALLPLFWRKSRGAVFFAFSFCATVLVCTTYQTSMAVFPLAALFVLFKDWLDGGEGKTVAKQLGIAVAGYLGGAAIFAKFLMYPQDAYVSNSMPPLKDLIPHAFREWRVFWHLVLTDFRIGWLLLCLVIFCSFLVMAVLRTKKSKPLALLLGLGVLGGSALTVFGLYPALQTPSYAARAMYGVGVLIALAAVFVSTSEKAYIGKASALALAWIFFVFAFTYGNALYEQQQYDKFRTDLLAEDLNDLTLLQEADAPIEVEIIGEDGRAPALAKKPPGMQRMLDRLVIPGLRADWVWGEYRLFRYYGLPIKWNFWEKPEQAKVDSLPVLKETPYHTIYGDEELIVVEVRSGDEWE